MYVTFHHLLFPINLCFILLSLSPFIIHSSRGCNNLLLESVAKMCRINAQTEEY